MREVACFVDVSFFLKEYKRCYGKSYHATEAGAEKIGKTMIAHCVKHLTSDQNQKSKQQWKASPERMQKMFFYDCPPLASKHENPISGRTIDLSKTETALFRNKLHAVLSVSRNAALRLGTLDEKNGRWQIKDPRVLKNVLKGKVSIESLKDDDIVFYAPQKTVDMKIGLDMASLCYKRLVNKIVLISGDSDFVPAAKLVRKEGIEFVLDPMRADIKPVLQAHLDRLHCPISRQNTNEQK